MALDFDQAGRRAAQLLSAEHADARIDPDLRSFLLDHGRQTERAIVLLHGITSSPLQFRQLAERFYDRGYNVLTPRMPRHGFVNRLTTDHGQLTRAELIAYANLSVDIGRGLGRHLTVAGLSVSGTVAAWAFHKRSDVDLAVLIAPAFAPYGVPLGAIEPLVFMTRHLPNLFVWWDLRVRGRTRPPAGYPRFSTHALAESFQLGYDVYRAAATRAPAGKVVLTITNPGDRAVSTSATRAVLTRWRQYPAVNVSHYELGPQLGPLHDIIGPYTPTAQVDYVYPIVIDLVDRASRR